MTSANPQQPASFSIDVQQWKHDIQTFVDSTTRDLEAIADELSSNCSTGRLSSSQPRETRDNSSSRSTPGAVSGSQPPLETGVGNEDRLSKLKSQLAQRISKTD